MLNFQYIIQTLIENRRQTTDFRSKVLIFVYLKVKLKNSPTLKKQVEVTPPPLLCYIIIENKLNFQI